MANKLVSEIATRMREKPTEELLSIWSKNDREEWSAEAFAAIAVVLKERKITVPERVDQRVHPLGQRRPSAGSSTDEVEVSNQDGRQGNSEAKSNSAESSGETRRTSMSSIALLFFGIIILAGIVGGPVFHVLGVRAEQGSVPLVTVLSGSLFRGSAVVDDVFIRFNGNWVRKHQFRSPIFIDSFPASINEAWTIVTSSGDRSYYCGIFQRIETDLNSPDVEYHHPLRFIGEDGIGVILVLILMGAVALTVNARWPKLYPRLGWLGRSMITLIPAIFIFGSIDDLLLSRFSDKEMYVDNPSNQTIAIRIDDRVPMNIPSRSHRMTYLGVGRHEIEVLSDGMISARYIVEVRTNDIGGGGFFILNPASANTYTFRLGTYEVR